MSGRSIWDSIFSLNETIAKAAKQMLEIPLLDSAKVKRHPPCDPEIILNVASIIGQSGAHIIYLRRTYPDMPGNLEI